jgi:VWFA-related protein
LWIVLAWFAFGVPATFGDSQPVRQTGFIDSVEVNIVNVPVFVTDRQGHRVNGLSKDDFRVFEDGKRVEITHFFEALGQETDALDAGFDVADSRHRHIDESGRESDLDAVNIVIYLDDVNTSPSNRAVALRILRESILSGLHEPNRAMLISYSHGLEVLQVFTSNPLLMASALERVESRDTSSVAVSLQTHAFLEEIEQQVEQLESMGQLDNLEQSIRGSLSSHAQLLRGEMLQSLEYLRYVVSAMSHLPGRNVILYLSDGPGTAERQVASEARKRVPELVSLMGSRGGFSHGGKSPDAATPMTTEGGVDIEPGTALAPGISSSRNLFDSTSMGLPGDLFTPITDLANTVGVPIYLANAESLTAPAQDALPSESSSMSKPRSSERLRDSKFHSGNTLLADATGGKVFRTTDDLSRWLTSILNDSSAYYLLGYRPRQTADGESHSIKVKVDVRQSTLRYRTGYVAHPRRTQEIQLVFSALLFSYDHNPLGVQLQTGPPNSTGEGDYSQPVRILVPITQLSFERHGREYQASIDVFVATMSSAGKIALPVEATVPIRVPADTMHGRTNIVFPVDLVVQLPRGQNTVSVAVRGSSSGMSFASRSVLVD